MFRNSWFALAACLLCVGCANKGPQLVDVEGVVRLDGAAVPNAQVLFVPLNVKPANPSYGLTDAEGRYKLLFTREKSGAVIGEHSVKIQVQRYSREERDNMRAAGQDVSDVFVAVPKKYNQDGELTANVGPGRNVIDFDLTAK